LTFGGERLAVDLSQVHEIFRLDSITSVPGMPPVLVGVANLRGTIVPIVDLHPWFGLPRVATLNYAVVVKHKARHVGIRVDDLPKIQAIGVGEVLEPVSWEVMSQRPFLSGVLHTVGLAIGMMESSKLLAMVDGSVGLQTA
jgi:purine-binding chemotaxis protein CheW